MTQGSPAERRESPLGSSLAFALPLNCEFGRESDAGRHVHQLVDGELAEPAIDKFADSGAGDSKALGGFLLSDPLTLKILL